MLTKVASPYPFEVQALPQSSGTATMVSAGEIFSFIVDLGSDPKHARWISHLLLAFESALCALIIMKVPCM